MVLYTLQCWSQCQWLVILCRCVNTSTGCSPRCFAFKQYIGQLELVYKLKNKPQKLTSYKYIWQPKLAYKRKIKPHKLTSKYYIGQLKLAYKRKIKPHKLTSKQYIGQLKLQFGKVGRQPKPVCLNCKAHKFTSLCALSTLRFTPLLPWISASA